LTSNLYFFDETRAYRALVFFLMVDLINDRSQINRLNKGETEWRMVAGQPRTLGPATDR